MDKIKNKTVESNISLELISNPSYWRAGRWLFCPADNQLHGQLHHQLYIWLDIQLRNQLYNRLHNLDNQLDNQLWSLLNNSEVKSYE